MTLAMTQQWVVHYDYEVQPPIVTIIDQATYAHAIGALLTEVVTITNNIWNL